MTVKTDKQRTEKRKDGQTENMITIGLLQFQCRSLVTQPLTHHTQLWCNGKQLGPGWDAKWLGVDNIPPSLRYIEAFWKLTQTRNLADVNLFGGQSVKHFKRSKRGQCHIVNTFYTVGKALRQRRHMLIMQALCPLVQRLYYSCPC